LNFQVKHTEFYARSLRKTYLWPEIGTGRGLIDPWGAKDVQRRGGGVKI